VSLFLGDDGGGLIGFFFPLICGLATQHFYPCHPWYLSTILFPQLYQTISPDWSYLMANSTNFKAKYYWQSVRNFAIP